MDSTSSRSGMQKEKDFYIYKERWVVMFPRLVTEPPDIEITCYLIILKSKVEVVMSTLFTDDFTTQSFPLKYLLSFTKPRKQICG